MVSQTSLDEMFARQNGNAPLDFDQGIGLSWYWSRPNFYWGKSVEHEGASPWFHAQIQILRDHQLGVIVLSNTQAADVTGIADMTLAYALREKKGIVPPPDSVPAYSPPDTSWTQAQLQALAGTYVAGTSGMNFGTITIDAATGAFRVQGQSDLWIPRQNGYFSLADAGPEAQSIQYRFQTVDGRAVISALVPGRESIYAERYEQGAIPAAWTAQQGAYVATNINPGSSLWPGTNTVVVEVGSDGILRLKGTLQGDIPIKPLSDTVAITGGIGRNKGESVRVVTVDSGRDVLHFFHLSRERMHIVGWRWSTSKNRTQGHLSLFQYLSPKFAPKSRNNIS